MIRRVCLVPQVAMDALGAIPDAEFGLLDCMMDDESLMPGLQHPLLQA